VGVVCLCWLVLCRLGWNIFVMMITAVMSCSYFLKAGRSCGLVVFLECSPVDFVFK
jgi:hypothetical protein